ncbi:hypothetical protein R3P38DRAFT_1601223 [Favolaschia claudopus]|uniref:Uncharacterized protein n=1 Tax=Favolaschia claudopus TaxID=2862362 RepID=A0AAW0AGB0_9AGAR
MPLAIPRFPLATPKPWPPRAPLIQFIVASWFNVAMFTFELILSYGYFRRRARPFLHKLGVAIMLSRRRHLRAGHQCRRLSQCHRGVVEEPVWIRRARCGADYHNVYFGGRGAVIFHEFVLCSVRH